MALRRRAEQAKAAADEAFETDVGGSWGRFPGLLEWLTAEEWEDSKPRVTGTVMLFREGGRWKAWLHDRGERQGSFVTAGTLDGLLAAAEQAVLSGEGDWRPDRKVSGRGT